MPGILQPKGEQEEEGKGEVEEGIVKEKPVGNGATENSVQEREHSCVSCSSPEADLNNSSSTLASSEGDMDSKNEDTLSSLDNPLPERTGQDGGEGEAGKASGGAAGKKQNLALNSEITTINLRLMLPGVSQPVEVTMSSRDTVHDLSQMLLERPECCYRTCTSAWYHKKRLDDFCELGMVEGLKQGDVVELVEEPYSQKDIRVHLQRLRELLTISPFQQALTHSDGMSLSLLAAITLKDQEEIATRPQDDFVDLSQLEPPSYCLPQDGTIPLSAFYPPNMEVHFKVPECVKLISYSQWNPPPSHRRMKGDLLYLDVVTLEGMEHYVTACPSGFFLNRSTARDAFNPLPKKTSHHSTHLVGLLSAISPLFKKNFTLLQKFGEKRHPYELLPISYPLYPWLAPKPEHKPSPFRLSDGMQLKAAPDEVIMGQMRDWNEEVQTARELPVDTPQLKVFRDRTIHKIHCDLVQVATRGAMLVVDGFIPALNPGDEEKFRMFLWNNLFFSLAFDGRDHYRVYGGDEAAHAAASGDLHGVEMFERLETKGLYTLQTVVVDYRGYRVVCQSIVPGLLWREQEAAVMYGSIDGGKNIAADSAFSDLLKQAAMELHIRPHKLKTESGEVVELPSSLEVKGIFGTDSRRYALDLFRVFPPDPNYTVLEEEEGGGGGGEEGEGEKGEKEGEKGKKEEVKEGGKSEEKRGYRHKLAVLRPELLETFLQYRYLLFLKLAREKASKLQIIQDLQKALLSQDSEKDPSDASPSDHSSTVTATTSTCGSTTTTSVEAGEKSDSDPGVESRQSNDVIAAGVVHSECPYSKVASPKSNPSDPDSNLSSPGTRHKSDTSLSRRGTGLGGTGRGHRSILSALGGGGGGGGSLEGAPGEQETPRGEGSGEKDPHTLSMSNTGSGDVLLVDGLQLLVEEKEVEPDVLPGADILSTSDDHNQEVNLQKELNTSDVLNSHPEVIAALQEAALEAGSSGGEEFDIRFNVDALSPGLTHADPPEVLERDRKLLHEAASFLTDVVIPRMLRECIQLSLVPMDGESLKVAMHSRGINMRYLGRIAKLASSRYDLDHLTRLCVSGMVVRVARRRLRRLLQDTPYEKVSEAIAHFLNCLLGQTDVGKEHNTEETSIVNGHHTRKKQRKKKNSKGPLSSDTPHLKVTPSNLWAHIVTEIEDYYKYTIAQGSVVVLCSELGIQRVNLLGELCKKTGIQMVAQDYDFTSRTPFTEEDIASLFPIVKHTHFRSTECAILFELAQSKFSSGSFSTAHDLYMEALQMFIQIYGPLNINVANCYRQVAKINYMVGEAVVALSFQHKAVLVYERVLGIDHPETLSSYINLAIYCHNTNQTSVALRLMYRARYLLTMTCGEDHPEVATCDCNIALMLHGFKQYEKSLRFLENSLKVFEKYHGKQSLQAALTHHLIARVQSFLGDFRAALQHEKSTYTIYNNKFGGDHERTKESSECLKELTQKAVTMQKTINEMTGKGKAGSGGKVLVDLPGSWGDVASMINATDTATRHPPRGQKPVTKTHVIRRRKPSKQQQQPASPSTKPADKQPPPPS